jgi:serine/threonine protein kinase
MLPLFYHARDVDMRMTAARCFGAAKKAISALRRYYSHDLAAINALGSRAQPEFPYKKQYTALSDSTVHTFRYISAMDPSKLVFRARTDSSDDVCVKFVDRYSKEVHEKCFSMGFAPALRGFERLPGGWYMVVMDYIDDSYTELFEFQDLEVRATFSDEILEKVESLHQAGFVHGDIRSTNIMVKQSREQGIMLIDFDWAGEIGTVVYPMNINRKIRRPEGARGGKLIKAEHDIDMVAMLFKYTVETIERPCDLFGCPSSTLLGISGSSESES